MQLVGITFTYLICYMLCVTCYMLHVICYMLYVTCYIIHASNLSIGHFIKIKIMAYNHS